MDKLEKADLIEEALADLTRIECDCGRQFDISRYIDRRDIEKWLEENDVQEL